MFVKEVRKIGIYLPFRDATWETEEHSTFYNYRDMYIQDRSCGAKVCYCRLEAGRDHHETDSDWEVVLCDFCGTAGVHIVCGGLDKADPVYGCRDCDNKKVDVETLQEQVACRAFRVASHLRREAWPAARTEDGDMLGL